MDQNKEQPNTSGEGLKTVHTYLSDMADTVRQNDISVMKVALAEQNRKEREDLYRKVEGTPLKKVLWFIGGVILILGAIYSTYFLLKQKAIKDTPAPVARQTSIISYDEINKINLNTGDSLIDKLNKAISKVSTLTKSESIDYFPISLNIAGNPSPITTANLFSMLSFTAPEMLIHSVSDNYMIGTYTKMLNDGVNITQSSPYLFMIFQVTDYEYAYAGMLAWEKTLSSDMYDLFNLETKYNKLQLSTIPWKDTLLNNKDARVLVNEDGKPILYYMFADKNDLVIAGNVDVLKEIISKLMLNNIKPL